MLTPKEKEELNDKLVHALKDKTEILEEKKTSMSEYRTQIQEKDEFIQKSTLAILDGNEEREVECEVRYHQPQEGIKTIIRKDTGEEWTEDMTADELQEELFDNK